MAETREIGTEWIARAVAAMEDAATIIGILADHLEQAEVGGRKFDTSQMVLVKETLVILRKRLIEAAAPF